MSYLIRATESGRYVRTATPEDTDNWTVDPADAHLFPTPEAADLWILAWRTVPDRCTVELIPSNLGGWTNNRITRAQLIAAMKSSRGDDHVIRACVEFPRSSLQNHDKTDATLETFAVTLDLKELLGACIHAYNFGPTRGAVSRALHVEHQPKPVKE